jgi:hypothetical protein
MHRGITVEAPQTPDTANETLKEQNRITVGGRLHNSANRVPDLGDEYVTKIGHSTAPKPRKQGVWHQIEIKDDSDATLPYRLCYQPQKQHYQCELRGSAQELVGVSGGSFADVLYVK